MDKFKYLMKNMSFLVLSQFGIKILNFLLVPLYTSILTTEEYGINDLFNTSIALLIPFLTINIRESVIRFSLDEEYDTKQVFSISICYCIKSVICVTVLLAINSIFDISHVINNYKWFIFFMFVSQVLNGIMTSFIRGLDKLKDVAVSSVICSLSIIVLNIITLLFMNMGLEGYFIANISGSLVQSIYLFVVCKGWKYIILFNININLKKEMKNYSAPMIANATAWWINGVSDRYIITWLCGTAANGVYSVANKIPSILDVFQNIFSQAWTISAVKEFDSEDKNGFFSKIYNMYNMCMTIMCSGFIVISRFLAKILYAKDFYAAWQYVPFLMIAVLFGALAGYAGAIFAAARNSKMYAYSTIAGAVVNIILNIFMVKPMGPLGAAIATAICYVVIYAIRISNVLKHIKLKLSFRRDIVVYLMLYVQSFLFLLYQIDCVILYVMQSIIFVVICICFIKEIKEIMNKIFYLVKG